MTLERDLPISASSVHLAKLIPPLFREPVREVRNFRRFPFVVRDPAPGPHVVLYGIPYGDWNVALTQAGVWRGIASRVVRVPAVGSALLSWVSSRAAVFIPMKEVH